MSINKIYLPETDKLIESLNEAGSSRFYLRYVRNKDVFIGPSESMDFINKFIKKYESVSEDFKII